MTRNGSAQQSECDYDSVMRRSNPVTVFMGTPRVSFQGFGV